MVNSIFKKVKNLTFYSLFLILLISCVQLKEKSPPSASKYPKEIVQHGHKRVDNYFWLRDKNWQQFIEGNLNFDNLEIKEYLEKEALYTDHTLIFQ